MINAIYFYKISRWLYLHKIPLLPKIFQFIIFFLYNSKIEYHSKIGKGTYFVCKGISTVIIPGTEIGDNCTIGLRFSTVRKFPYKNVPKIGNNVWIGPNVVIAGPVIIEDNALIGANTFLDKSVPSGAIVAGNPAKIIGWRSNLDFDINLNPKFKEGTNSYLKYNKE